MDPFVGAFAAVIKLTFKIIEAVIRGLIEATILLAAYTAVGTSCMLIGILFVR